jgi:amino acid transporter
MMTPPKRITLQCSIIMAGIAVACLIAGWFIAAGIVGTAAAINLIAGSYLRRY